jgi:Domain of unknown function (DUF4431)
MPLMRFGIAAFGAVLVLLATRSPAVTAPATCLSLDSKVRLIGTVLRHRDLSASGGADRERTRTYYVLSLDAPVCIDGQQPSPAALQIEFRRFAFKRKWVGRHVSVSGSISPASSSLHHTPVVIRSERMRMVPFAPGSFPLVSCEGVDGTITELVGVNTAQARIRGVVTAADFEAYCDRDPEHVTMAHGGKLTRPQCTERAKLGMGRGPAVMTVTADCEQGLIRIGSDREYQLRQTKGGADGDVEFAWREIRTGQILDASCGSRAPLLSKQFRLLCPGRASGVGERKSGAGNGETGTR